MKDVLIDEGNDIIISNGDFAIGDSDIRHQEHILIANKGEFKEFPEMGVGIIEALNSDDIREVLDNVKRNFQYDGMYVNNITYDGEKLITDAKYRDNG